MNTKSTSNSELQKLICEFLEFVKKYEGFTGNKYEDLLSNKFRENKVMELLKDFATTLSEQEIKIDTATYGKILNFLVDLTQTLINQVQYKDSDNFKDLSFSLDLTEYFARIVTKNVTGQLDITDK